MRMGNSVRNGAMTGWLFGARADIVLSGADWLLVRILTCTFTGYFTLNVLMNLFLSQSVLKKAITAPASRLLELCSA